ncbi:hypothetical protein GO308_18280 [Sphingomonas sp. SFZ2018-12]|uniref:hypothetical protein n=1 Tax=Sphingomonas sp. SFZ2018-12 TaxID=2683197 RepID=UPI001F0F792A|nr:hypothetical protein [Sphingomonas sp. SFZ2018-12]MCH4895051.1 hypothetical protein [Sphingomonas sp. SFZ2018-12]
MAPPASFSLLGTVTPRSAAQLKAAGITSPFSIGGETTDRNFSTYANWRTYLGPLGFPKARVQTGWADVERVRGTYDFAKLDTIVTDMKAQSVEPWFDLVYGNALYSGGGGTGLGAALPSAGSEGRAAWLNFVRATVAHFNTPERKVTEWQIWNEPDLGPNSASVYATFAAQTARAIKEVQPEAKILLGGFTQGVISNNYQYGQTVLTNFANEKGSTVPNADVQVVYHPYNANPDASYSSTFDSFRASAEARGFTIRQGENGAPSASQPEFALNNLPWTEDAQAKWALRRLLGDFRRGIESNLFTLTELHYASAKNLKGILQTGAWSSAAPTYGDQTVQRPKAAYRAVQSLAAIFDSRLTSLFNQGCTLPSGYTIQAYTRLDANDIRRNMLVVWRNNARPGENEATAAINITCTVFQFPRFASNPTLRPRYVDLLTGRVYALTSSTTVVQGASGVTITGLPVYDSPVVLADQGIALFN